MCLLGAIGYLVSAFASLAIFIDPAIAADFDGDTARSRTVGILAVLSAVVSGLLVFGALWRGPKGARVAGVLVLCFIGLPVSCAAVFAFALS